MADIRQFLLVTFFQIKMIINCKVGESHPYVLILQKVAFKILLSVRVEVEKMAEQDPSRELLRDLLERGQNELFPKLRSRVLSIIELYNQPLMQQKLCHKKMEVERCLLQVQVIFNYDLKIAQKLKLS